MGTVIRPVFFVIGVYVFLIAMDNVRGICPPGKTLCTDHRNGGTFRRNLIERLLDSLDSEDDLEKLKRALDLFLEERDEEPVNEFVPSPQQNRELQRETERNESDTQEDDLRMLLRVLTQNKSP